MIKKSPLCVLIYPNTREVEHSHPDVPYSILFVGSYLRARGIAVKLFDQRVTHTRKIIQYVRANPVTHVGLSVMTGPQISFAIALSIKIRRACRDVTIIWGGVHVTVLPESVLKSGLADYLVIGEGEQTCYELVLSEQGASVPGALRTTDALESFEPRAALTMDELPLDWTLINVERYIGMRHGRRSMMVLFSRGCPLACRFCVNSILKNPWRSWSVPRVRQEIDRIRRFGVSHLTVCDDNPCGSRQWFGEVCDVLAEAGIVWYAPLRASSVTERNMDRFANCVGVYVGAESGSQRILDQLNKGITVDDIYAAAEILQARKMLTMFSWMIGFPSEDRDDVLMTVDALKRVSSIAPGTIQRIKMFTPYPGSVLFEQAVDAGLRPPRTLAGWGDYHREGIAGPYITNPWWYKSIIYSSAFHHYTSEWLDAKWFFRPILAMYKALAGVRWRTNFFRLPLEYWPLDVGRTVLRRMTPLGAQLSGPTDDQQWPHE